MMEQYIPEYNPTKYLKAKRVALLVGYTSIIVLLISIYKLINNYESFSSILGISIGLTTLIVGFSLAWKFNKLNKIFSEPNELKRLEMHQQLIKEQEEWARKIG